MLISIHLLNWMSYENTLSICCPILRNYVHTAHWMRRVVFKLRRHDEYDTGASPNR
jgi:hypothetical protein